MQRFKRGGDDDKGAIATEERVHEREATAPDQTAPEDESTAVAPRADTAVESRDDSDVAARDDATGAPTTTSGIATTDALQTARARQRDEYGGINWGASFFGWLVAVGLAALLTAILAAAGAALDLTTTTSDSELGSTE